MPDLYTAADVCVARAGAMTVAELLVAGVPAILVPLPGAPRDHQTRNAEAMVGMGAAVHVPDPECTGERLAEELDALLGDPARLRAMSDAARGTRTPTRRPGSPSWSTPMPADDAAAGAAGPRGAATHPRRRHRGRRHERHRAGAAGHGPHRLGLGPEGFARWRSASAPTASRWRWGTGRSTSPGADVLTFSPAVPPENPELVEARARGIRVVPRSEMLAAICATRSCLAVAGTHGKTTTASMLSLILVEAGLRPSFVIGADVNEIGTNAVWDSGDWLVVEADESYGTFQAISPDLAVLTERRAGPPRLLRHVRRRCAPRSRAFLAGAGGGAVVCADDPEAAAIGREHGAITVGTAPGSTYAIGGPRRCSAARCRSTCGGPDGALGILRHRSARPAQRPERRAWPRWPRSEPAPPSRRRRPRWPASPVSTRRFEFRGEARGVTFVDDYAHLPTEVRAALATAQSGGWSRVVAVFQPHRFSRTAALATQFGDCVRRRRRAGGRPTSTAPASGPSPESRAAWWPTRSGRRIRGCP